MTPIFATSYVRTRDGFLTSIHDTALDVELDGTFFLVPIFNPASNVDQRSLLRITNLGKARNGIDIFGLDDAGIWGVDVVRFSIGGQQSVLLDAAHLENGIPDVESGGLGDGKGKWQLLIRSEDLIRPASLMVTPQGHITNLSTMNFAVPTPEDLGDSDAPPLRRLIGNRLRAHALEARQVRPLVPPGLTDFR